MIYSILALLAICISLNIKERKKSLYVQSLNCFFESLYDFTIEAYTGAILSLITFVRSLIFAKKDKFHKMLYLMILILFEGIIIVNCYFSWAGIISLLPTIASLIRTYCLWQSDMRLVRMSGLTTGIMYGSYYIYYHSWFMVLGDAILFLAAIYAMFSIDFKPKRKRSLRYA